MIISYQTRQLKDEILNDFLLQNKFPQEEVVKKLRITCVLSAADNPHCQNSCHQVLQWC